jgi:hypothetical protein
MRGDSGVKIGDIVFLLDLKQLKERDVVEGWDWRFLIPTLDLRSVEVDVFQKKLVPKRDLGFILQIEGNRANILTRLGRGWTRLDYLEVL